MRCKAASPWTCGNFSAAAAAVAVAVAVVADSVGCLAEDLAEEMVLLRDHPRANKSQVAGTNR